jgi:mycothiol synthase
VSRATSTTATLRPFAFPGDLPAMVELMTEGNDHDGIEWFPTVESLANDWSATDGFDLPRDTVVLEADGRLIGGARHSWREREGAIVHRMEVWVRPSERRQGHGRRLLAWAEARARESVETGAGGPVDLAHFFGGFTGRELPASAAFAEAMGYAPIRFHVEMRRPIDAPIPEAPLPDGLEVRPVVPEHHRAIWDADAEAFADHWDNAPVTEDDFRRFFAEPHIDTSLWQVAWDGDQVAGLVINAIVPHENERTGQKVGWLDSVATRRPWRRRGLAGALIARSLRVLGERGMEIAALGVDSESPTGALRLYESFGFEPVRTWMFLRKPF